MKTEDLRKEGSVTVFSKISVKKPYTVIVGIILVLVLGGISFMNLTTDLLPSMNLPYVVVYTSYIGASPESVESTVTKPLEAAMSTVGELKNISSTSGENVSTITLQFNDNANMDTAMIELNAKIDLVKPNWPDEVGAPVMMKLNPDMLPVMVASVDRDDMDVIGLSGYVDDTLLSQLEGIDGVASVTANGLIEEEVTVTIEQSLIDQINSKILKEVDAELYKVELKLIDGENKLLDAKKMLDRKGKAGLNQIDDGLKQLEEGQGKLGPAISQLGEKKQQLVQQLAQAQAAIPALKAGIAQMSASRMSDADRRTLEELSGRIAQYEAQVATAQAALDKVDEQLGLRTPAPTLAPTPAPSPSPTPAGVLEDPKKLIKSGEKIADIDLASHPSATPHEQVTTDAPSKPKRTSAPVNSKPGTASSKRKPGAAHPRANADVALSARKDLHNARAFDRLGADFELFSSASADALMDDDALRAEKARLEGEIAQLKGLIAGIKHSSGYQGLLKLAEADGQLTGMEKQLAELEAAIPQMQGGISQIDMMVAKLEQGIVPGGLMEGIDQDTNLEDAKTQLTQTRKTVKSQLKTASAQIEKGQKELGEARKEFEDKREEAFKDAKLDGVITVEMIGQIIAAQNFSMPAGYLSEEGQKYLVRVGDEYQDISELKDTVLFTLDLDSVKEVRLRDVADVGITNNADTVYAKVNGNDGVLLSFSKQSTFSTAEVANSILAAFKQLEQDTPGLRLTPLVNQGIYIDMIIESVLGNLLSGALLAILVLLIFLGDFRPTMIIALSIPLSLVIAVVAMYFSDITLNVMSLAGLALGVGMLVDNSIVVIENIYRLRNDGLDVIPACIEGTQQMAGPIFSSTLTTICVFLPLVFITGIAKMLFTDLGLTITYSLMASLLVAMTVVPAMSSKVLKRKAKVRKHSLFTATQRGYARLLNATLRFKLPVLLLSLVLMVFSGMQAIKMGTSFIPDVDSNQMTASLMIPTDYNYDERVALSNQVLEKLLTVEDVETIGVFDAKGTSMIVTGNKSGDAMNYYITLVDGKKRRNTAIADDMIKAVEPLNCDLSVSVSNMDISMLGGSGISVKVKGPDIDKLRAYTTDIADKISKIEGVIDVSDGQEHTVPELTFKVDKQEAIKNGLTVAQIYQYVAMQVSDGVEVSTLTENGREYAIMAVDGKNADLTREDLADRTIEVKKADETIQVRLGDVCEIKEAESLSSIDRDQQQHVLSASCGVDSKHNIGLVGREVEKIVSGLTLESGYTATLTGESDTVSSALGDLVNMILLSVVLIYLIMVAQFQSFLSPFIVLFTIPLAVTGGLLALIACGMDISVVGMLGFLILAGVIVNNGIVFVDSVNQLIIGGMEKRPALIEAGRLRLRPILMTALTTILGMSTMALGQGMGAEMMQPLAVVTIGGLTYGTLLTLFVVPILYDLFTGKKVNMKHLDGGAAAQVAPESVKLGGPDAPDARAHDEDEVDPDYFAQLEDEADQAAQTYCFGTDARDE
ncbi:MAG: efflux RND transporter permease subunit [Clostridia bacterium]